MSVGRQITHIHLTVNVGLNPCSELSVSLRKTAATEDNGFCFHDTLKAESIPGRVTIADRKGRSPSWFISQKKHSCQLNIVMTRWLKLFGLVKYV